MEKENKTLMFSALINIIVSVIKIGGGLIFNSYTFIIDGYYTVVDFITDILAMVGAKVSRRRANKRFPFGFGRIEYISQMLVGVIIISVGIFSCVKSFGHEFEMPNLNVLYLVFIAIALKALSSSYLLKKGKEIRSTILTTSAKESFMDVISSSIVFVVIIIGQFYSKADLIGSLIMGIMICISGIKIIIDNITALIGEDVNNKQIKKDIEKIIKRYKDIEYSDSSLIKFGLYYKIEVEIAIEDNLNVNELIKKEKKISNEIKKLKYKIKFITYNIILK